MAENSNIEWTHHTFNPWRGCTKVSEGCANCYAETLSGRNPGTLGVWGPNGKRVVASESQWKKPLKWNEQAKNEGVRYRVFCASLADVFEDWNKNLVDSQGRTLHRGEPWGEQLHWVARDVQIGHSVLKLDDVRRRLFSLIDATPHLDWLLVTKRPENIHRMWVSRVELQTDLDEIAYRPNVWLMTSVENQDQYDKRVLELIKCIPLVPVRGLSVEPLLGPIDRMDEIDPSELLGFRVHPMTKILQSGQINWVIAGGESGHSARPMQPDWARSIRNQCESANVPFFFKQWGGVNKKKAGRILDGQAWDQFPKPQHQNS